jgi:methionine synthase I (cobalamin-dependent)
MTLGLTQRLQNGENVLVAEGYVFEFERRGYLKAGPYVPEIVLEHPNLVQSLHEEFVHAGSDVVEAFTYYAHREKLRMIGRESDLEKINRNALKIARKVADETKTLMAGNICNSTVYSAKDSATWDTTKAIFKEQIEWAVSEKADFIIAETYSDFGEAKIALEAIKEYGRGLPAVITLGQANNVETKDGVPFDQACHQLESAGAAVVGLNCSSGPATIIPLMAEIRQACKGRIAALPVPFRTTPQQPQMQNLRIPETGERAFPLLLDRFSSTIDEIEKFGQSCKDIGIQYVGLCCGNSSRYFRTLAESLGRTPPASKYSADLSLHHVFKKEACCQRNGVSPKHRHGSHELSDQNWPSTV